ncbi:NUDIX hydrolase [Paraliobacillus zengyii]|uniref:NUDIX hydrolase n=2 Tax=Paraliobacillus TaxID=200903 RepID=UPI001F547E2E|nr:NUDIX hydrolase [Paraliobacillus zengyii]
MGIFFKKRMINLSKSSGCFTIVFNKDGNVLLAKRKDYPVWDFPGGTLEKEESIEQCAIRETKEETGYIIKIKKKVGEYYQPQYDDMQHIFLGELKGGKPIKDGPETEKVKWFSPNRLPLFMIPNRRKQLSKYLSYKDILIQEAITVSPMRTTLLKIFFKTFSKVL